MWWRAVVGVGFVRGSVVTRGVGSLSFARCSYCMVLLYGIVIDEGYSSINYSGSSEVENKAMTAKRGMIAIFAISR